MVNIDCAILVCSVYIVVENASVIMHLKEMQKVEQVV